MTPYQMKLDLLKGKITMALLESEVEAGKFLMKDIDVKELSERRARRINELMLNIYASLPTNEAEVL